MAAMLRSLSPELIEHIASSLAAPKDLLSLRLVCRSLDAGSARAFDALFRDVKTDLSRSSVERISGIAKHPRLRLCVKRLIVCRLPDSENDAILGQDLEWARLEAMDGRRLEGRINLASPLVTAIHQTLRDGLVNCNSFDITDACSGDLNMDGTEHSLSPTDVIAILFALFADPEFHRAPQTVRVRLFRQDSQVVHERFDPGLLVSPQFRHTFSQLHHLELSWDFGNDPESEIAARLVSVAAGLKTLTLSGVYSDGAEFLMQKLTTYPHLPALKVLRLARVRRVRRATLLALLGRFQDHLTCVGFYQVHLIQGKWRAVLARLGSSFPRLSTLTIQSCLEIPELSGVYFCPIAKHPSISSWGILTIVYVNGQHLALPAFFKTSLFTTSNL
jgi:hypothetical protein